MSASTGDDDDGRYIQKDKMPIQYYVELITEGVSTSNALEVSYGDSDWGSKTSGEIVLPNIRGNV